MNLWRWWEGVEEGVKGEVEVEVGELVGCTVRSAVPFHSGSAMHVLHIDW